MLSHYIGSISHLQQIALFSLTFKPTNVNRGKSDLHKYVSSDHSCLEVSLAGGNGVCPNVLQYCVCNLSIKMATACTLTNFKQFLLKSLSITFLKYVELLAASRFCRTLFETI